MVLRAVCDREIRESVKSLLAYERRAPITIRLVVPRIKETSISGEDISVKIRKLISFKAATILLLVNPKSMDTAEEKAFLDTLEEMGVRVHYHRKLHAKVILLESGKEWGALISSANLTTSGLGKNKEVGVFIFNEALPVFDSVKDYVKRLMKESAESLEFVESVADGELENKGV